VLVDKRESDEESDCGTGGGTGDAAGREASGRLGSATVPAAVFGVAPETRQVMANHVNIGTAKQEVFWGFGLFFGQNDAAG